MPLGERRFVLLVVLVLAVLTSLPYAAGLRSDAPGRFLGTLSFEQDTNAYLGFARQAQDGALLFVNPFTPEPHAPALVNPEWLVMGWVAALPGSSVEAGYHAVRLLALVLLAFGVARLCALLFAGLWMRRLVLLAVLTGGGFGWWLLLPGAARLLVDVNAYDLFAGLHPFFGILQQPHFLLAQALAAWVLVLLIRERGWSAGALLALLGLVRPFDMVALLVGLFVFGVALRRWRLVLRAAAPSLLVLGYDVWLFRIHPVFRWWHEQNVSLPPDPDSLAFGLGLVALLLLVQFLRSLARRREPDPPRVLLSCALLAALLLLYAYPVFLFTLQFMPAVAVPATLVAAMNLEPAVQGLLARRRGLGKALLVGLLVVHGLTSFVLFDRSLDSVRRGEHRVSRELVAAYEWLGAHAEPDDVVLAAPQTCNQLPRFARLRTYCGYAYATVDYAHKQQMAVRYLSGQRTGEAEAGVRFVLIGPAERELVGKEDVASPDGARLCIAAGEVVVYELTPP